MVLYRMGNKQRIVHRILPFIPPHQLWIEPFFGTGAMLWAKPRTRSIVNDRDSEVFNLFCVIQDQEHELQDAWCAMPIHEDLWKHWRRHCPTDPVQRAVRFLFQSNFSFLGKGGTLVWNRKNAKRLLQDRIKQTRELLYDVEFMNVDFRCMLGRIPLSKGDRRGALIYCDPPYLDTANNYGMASAWNEGDTRDLLAMLASSGMRFAMSEFDHPTVLKLAKEHGLQVVTIGDRHNLRNRRTEILVCGGFTA
ncbi:MAG: DNA adenine methylase [Flavobacteriales bacterium]|nr:DNA adenine methylase [Flavobacteriales bacterium]